LNGGTPASVGTYYQMSKIPVIGTGVNFSLAGNGLISQWLTDVGDPNFTEIPAGAWNFEMFFSASSAGGTPEFYVELLKYDGVTFTTIADSSLVPEAITGGTTTDLYITSVAVPLTSLLVTDRLAIRVYIVNSILGRTITQHTQDSTLNEIITTFSSGVSSINGLTAQTQYLAVGTSGTDFNIDSTTDIHTFNLPTASATNRGALSTTDWTNFDSKQPAGSYATGTGTADGTNTGDNATNTLYEQAKNGSFGMTVDGGGALLTSGNIGYITMPYSGTITGWQVIGDIVGTCVFDVWKTAAGIIPTMSNSIVGTEKPNLTAQQINSDLSLTTWTTAVSAGDIVGISLETSSLLSQAWLTVFITKQ